MPIYEYKCKKCKNDFELLLYQGEIPVCPKCNSKDVEKKFSVFATSCGTGTNKDDSYLQGTSSSCGCGSCSGKSCATCK
ncbi:MAG: zinc ribbon domain-containing protein [Endomicrobiia bacterium]